MNIAFVNATRKWGGVKSWMLDVGEALHARGHAIRVYGRQPDFVGQARHRIGHGETVVFGPDLNPLAVLRFARAFRSQRIQAVFVNVGKDLATAGVAAHLLGIPVIQRVGMPEDIPERFKSSMLHRVIRPRFFCPCRYIADGFMRKLPYIRPDRVHTLLTAKAIPDTTLVPHAPRRLVATQQLNADKGHDVILRALAGVSAPFEFHVAGTGRREAELKRLADALHLGERVVWHGFTTDIPHLLRQSDIFLLASLHEGLPNTLLEAMAHGLLPIVRDVGGVREVLTPELEPWLLPEKSGPEAFRSMIERALTLPDADLLAVREASRAACRLHCDIGAMILDLEHWLDHEVIRGH